MTQNARTGESGNVVFFILLGIALIGLVTAALRSTSTETANIDREQMVVRVSQIKQYASELERAVGIIQQNMVSESDLSFAHPDAPSDYGTYGTNAPAEIFNVSGGGAGYKQPPEGLNDGSPWEFYGKTDAPDTGTDKADLIAVLPNVTPEFCTAANNSVGLTGTPQDTADCVNSGAVERFTGTFDDVSTNTMVDASFSTRPASQGCVTCVSDGSRHYFHVLLKR